MPTAFTMCDIISSMSNLPLDIRTVGTNELLVLWPDSHRSLYTFHYLRFNCCCAQCVDEWSGRRTITEDAVAQDIRALSWKTVGHYAVRFEWSDGHNTGIYGFDYLRKICPCSVCENTRKQRTV